MTTTYRRPRAWLRNSLPFWLLLPTLIVLTITQVYPGFYTIWLSLQTRKPDGWEYVGRDLLRSEGRGAARGSEGLFQLSLFPESVGHTVVFLIGFVILTLTVGFALALLLNRKLKFSGLYITLLYIPWVIADIIVGLVWRLLVVPDYGILSGITQNPLLFPPNGLSILTDVPPKPWIADFPFPPAPAMVYLAGVAIYHFVAAGCHANRSPRNCGKQSHRWCRSLAGDSPDRAAIDFANNGGGTL